MTTKNTRRAANDRALLAVMVERHPEAEWSDSARATALEIQTRRNAVLHWLLTGYHTLTVRGGIA